MRKNIIAAQAEEHAKSLSSFEGQENRRASSYEGSYEGNDDNYVGLDDDAIEFCGQGKSFLTIDKGSNLNFSFRLTNAAAAKKVIAFTPTYLGSASAINTATGETVDGVLTDGTIITSVTGLALNSKFTIANLQNFILRNPSQLAEITISANSTLAFDESIVLAQISPFRQLVSNRIPLTKYLNPEQYNTTKVVIPIWKDYPEFQFNDQLAILLPVGGTETVASTGVILNVTLSFGAVRNLSAELDKKARRASGNMTRMRMRGLLK